MLGILFYAYGAPQSIDDVPAYFEHIIGRTPPAPMMVNITQQFKDLQTADPITLYAPRIAEALETVLNQDGENTVRVYNAYKHTAPFTDDAIQAARADGCTELLTLTVNPIYSASGGGSFHEEVAEKVTDMPVTPLKNYYEAASIVEIYARRVKAAYDFLPREAKKKYFIPYIVKLLTLSVTRHMLRHLKHSLNLYLRKLVYLTLKLYIAAVVKAG